MTKIGLYLPYIYPCQTGGMEIFNYHISKYANQNNAIVYTTCRKLDIPNKRLLNDRIFILRRFGLGNLSLMLTMFFHLFKDRKEITCIYSPSTSNAAYLGYLLPLIKSIFNIPYSIHLHGGGMKPWKPIWLFKPLFKNANQIYAVSEKLKEEYEKRASRKIEVILPLIEFKIADLSKKEICNLLKINTESIVILSVGSLKQLKSPQTLLEAFIQLGKKFIEEHNLHLIFVGEGPLKMELVNITQSANLNSHITFTGLKSREDVEKYYKIASFYVISSHFEGTPLSLIEAFYNKIPCIGSNVNGIAQVIEDNINGLLFEKGNTNDLKAKLKLVIEDKELSNHLRLNAKNSYDSKYNFDFFIDDFYSKISTVHTETK
ncbi:MAG: glycosyltransferase family 4 protein [Bacteroidota bacterium]